MGPTSKNLKKKKERRIKQNIWRQSKQRESVAGSYIFLKFLVFKSSFSDSRVSVRQNLSG